MLTLCCGCDNACAVPEVNEAFDDKCDKADEIVTEFELEWLVIYTREPSVDTDNLYKYKTIEPFVNKASKPFYLPLISFFFENIALTSLDHLSMHVLLS